MDGFKEQAVIWGAGSYGKAALYYYRNRCDIKCFVDSDSNKWGNYYEEVIVNSPKYILENVDVTIIVALKIGLNTVKEYLREHCKDRKVIFFQIKENFLINEEPERDQISADSVVFSFTGGLGNQMFQYALFCKLKDQGQNLVADLRMYRIPGVNPFVLTDVFKNIHLEICSDKQINQFIKRNVEMSGSKRCFTIYEEANIYEVDEQYVDKDVLKIKSGIVRGLFQTYEYAEMMKKQLVKDFRFPGNREVKLEKVADKLMNSNAVSVHIRRGDYISSENNIYIYGNICTTQYYKNAMDVISEKEGSVVFCFFSNDIEWVKKEFSNIDAIYIERELFDEYQDWYDMYLMSICKHNIIANSTFSWWGAWLNQNRDKIVIAPQKWVNLCDYKNIYPEDWILI